MADTTEYRPSPRTIPEQAARGTAKMGGLDDSRRWGKPVAPLSGALGKPRDALYRFDAERKVTG